MTRAIDIVKMALKDAGAQGVGETLLPEDSNDAFTKLQWLLASWATRRWLVYKLDPVLITATGAKTYSVGPGGNVEYAQRPPRVSNAFIRTALNSGQPVDSPVEILQSRQDYDNVTVKDQTGMSIYLYYEAGFPLGTLYPVPIPQAGQYILGMSFYTPLQRFASITDEVLMPEEYVSALHWNLAQELRPQYQDQPDPTINAKAKKALNYIRGANAQVPLLKMPPVLNRRRGNFNIYTGWST